MQMKWSVLVIALGLSVAACSGKKSDPDPSATAAGPGANTPAATGKAAAPAAAKGAFVQKGIPAGKVAIGYVQDNADPSQCSVVTDAPAQKDDFAKNGPKFAEMLKGKVVPACPTDSVVGTCSAGFGTLVNYSGPKWTPDAAKKDCLGHPHAKWIE